MKSIGKNKINSATGFCDGIHPLRLRSSILRTMRKLPIVVLSLVAFSSPLVVFAAESQDYVITDDLLYEAAPEYVGNDFILEAAIVPESDTTDSAEIILAICGDGFLDDGEGCDTDDFGGESCQSLCYECGHLTCAADCRSYAVTMCSFAAPSVDNTSPPSSGGGAQRDNNRFSPTPRPDATPILAEPTEQPWASPAASATPAPRPSPSQRPTVQAVPSPVIPSPTPPSPTPRATPAPAAFLEFGPNSIRPPLTTNDGSPLIAGNLGVSDREGYLQVTDDDGNIVYQAPITPNQNGGFVASSEIDLPPGRYIYSVYDVTVPNADPLWSQEVRIGTAGEYRSDTSIQNDGSEQTPIPSDVADPAALRQLATYFGRQVGQMQEVLRGLTGREVVIDAGQVSDTVSHIAIAGEGAPLIPLDRPINLGTIGRPSDETLIIKGKARPGAKVIIYFEKQASAQELFDYGANLLFDPETDTYYYEAIADENGIFEIPIAAEMPEGDYVVRTAIIEIDDVRNRIYLGEDKEFAFTLFSVPTVKDEIVSNAPQGFLVNAERQSTASLWFAVFVGVWLVVLSIFLFHRRLTHFRKRPRRQKRAGEQSKQNRKNDPSS